MKTELQDTIFDTVIRLDDVLSQPHRPLVFHRGDRQRDGPNRYPESFNGLERVTAQARASQRVLHFDYHSKGKS